MSGELKGACIFGQSGGPTAVINASAYGVLKTALESDAITNVYGAAHGIRGVLDDRLYDIAQENPDELRLLLHTPSSELGSCRYKMADPDADDTDYRRILEIFRKYNGRYFFYNCGNDAMDTCNKISRYMQAHDWDCRVMGVPKTIDNDLFGTDHCPGFASAAKYIATSCMEVSKDCRVYDTGTITVMEIMGRHAGWLAGSAALASACGSGPDLIYLPEVDFDMEQFLADVHRIYEEKNNVLIAVSEGIHYADGSFVSEAKASATDGFGHAQLGGLAARLAQVIKEHEHAKVRGIELSLLQRAGAHLASQTDIDEAFAAGNADILISTTIVEVGVNIPNSTVIVIKNAERFGLAQLHQLRGRVGRSSYQSYCVLLSQDKENERLQTMASTTDGFKIAEKDLELRGTGQILGVKQSGKDVYMEMMLKYPKLYKEIRTQAAKDVILCENSA